MCVPDCLLLVCALKNHFLQSSPSCMRLTTASLSPLMSCALKPNFRFLLCQATPPLNKVTKENGSHVVTWKFVEKKVQKLKLPAKATRKEKRGKTRFFKETVKEGRNQISCHRISEKVCQADQIYHA